MEEDEISHKEDCFSETSVNGRRTYICNICGKMLSRKQRILTHLNLLHKKSPLKRVYSRYKSDSTLPVPKRTLMRHQASAREDETLMPDAPSLPVHLPETEQNVTSCEASTSSSYNSPGNIPFNLEDPGTTDTSSQFDQCSSSGSHNSSEDETSDDEDETSDDEDETSDDEDETSDDEDETSDDEDETSDDEDETSDDEDETSDDEDETSDDEEDDLFETEICEAIADEDVSQAPTSNNFSPQEINMLCMVSYLLRFNVSGCQAKALMDLLSILCPQSSKFQTLTLSDVLAFGDTSKMKSKHYCSLCSNIFPDDPDVYECTTDGCQGYRYQGPLSFQTRSSRVPRNVFVMGDTAVQLKYLLERKGVWDGIERVKSSHSTDFTDVVDGESYRALCEEGMFLANPHNISTVFNTDGVPLYNSSKVKLWPIFLAINELPPSQRFARENIIIAGIWQGKGNTPFEQYLYAFGEEMGDLYEKGISVQPSVACEPFVVKMAVLLATMDLQAKAYVLNMTMHNGSFGCSTCEEEGETVTRGKGYARHYPYKPHFERPDHRQSDDVKYQKGPQASRTHRIKGICGMTGLSSMPWFDIVDGVVPDYMHGVLLGVTKKLLYMWLSPTSNGKPYFVGKDITTISNRLRNICPPDYVERLPRDLEKNYNHLKASELQAWLLFYSIPCLNGILDDVYLEHFAHLSEGIYILLGDRITQVDLERAESLLEHFYLKFGELYGEGSCGLNVHNIGAHLVTFVRKWGPLWCWSCFPFEDMNADILKAVHGTGDVTSQYLNLKQLRLKICGINLEGVDQQRTDFIHSMKDGTNKCWRGLKKMKNCQIAGQPKPFTSVTASTQREILLKTDAQDLSGLRKLHRVMVNQQKLYSKEYTRMKKRVCYAVRCYNGIIGKVLFFILNVSSQNVFAVLKKMTLAQNCFFFETCGFHLMNVEDTDVIHVVPVNDIMEKVFFINIEDVSYVAMMPNIIGHGVFK